MVQFCGYTVYVGLSEVTLAQRLKNEWQRAGEILLLMGRWFTVEEKYGRLLNVG